MTPAHLRIARPVADIERTERMYAEGLGLRVLGSFRDHEGFDGVMLGIVDAQYHFEFTHSHRHAVVPSPTPEDLTVFYLPSEAEWRAACERMSQAGFTQVASFNPYWDASGCTFEDADGYRVVLQCATWTSVGREGR